MDEEKSEKKEVEEKKRGHGERFEIEEKETRELLKLKSPQVGNGN
jgi:hypothetical protein